MFVNKVKMLAFWLALASMGSGILYADISEGVISYYPMDGNADDVVGVNPGVLIGPTEPIGPTPAVDRFGNAEGALSFDGVDDYIDIGNDSSLEPPFPFSISAWVRVSPDLDPNTGFPIFNTNDTHGSYFGFVMFLTEVREVDGEFGRQVGIRYGNGGSPGLGSRRGKVGTTPLAGNFWYHVVGVVRGNEDMDIYVNGENDGGSYVGAADELFYNDEPGSIGRFNVNQSQPHIYAMGSMDDIIFYSRDLDAGDVVELYGLPAPTYDCIEFGPPLHNGALEVRAGNRVIHVTGQLQSPEDGSIITDEDLIAPPLVQIRYYSQLDEVIDVSDGAIAVGWGFDGNVFEYDPDTGAWRYGLRISNFTDPGTYTIQIISGDEWEYHVDSCYGSFEIVQQNQNSPSAANQKKP